MSNFRDKAREIKAEGEAQRGNFDPQGTPLRMYNYWLDNAESPKAVKIRMGMLKENFCHFWRVVAIWAPLMFLWKKVLEPVLESNRFFPAVMTVIALGLVISIFMMGGFSGLGWLGAALLGVAALIGVGIGLGELNYRFPKTMNKIFSVVLIALGSALALGILFVFLTSTGFVGAAALAVGIVIGLVVYYNISNIADFIEGLRAKAERAEDARRDKIREAVRNGTYVSPVRVKKGPGRVRKFFTGIGDFIIMLAQVVRVKKWGICPIVNLDTDGTR